jgi:hypothetical protein
MEVYVHRRILACVAVFVTVLPLHAQETLEDLQGIVQRAFTNVESDVQQHWRFAEVSNDGEVERVAHFDPRRPQAEHWELLTINGESPSPEQQTEFRKQKQEQTEREAKRNGREVADPLDSIDMTSLRLVADDPTGWDISFQPLGTGESKKMMSKMRGSLRISKPESCLELLEFASPGPVKPQIGVKVEHFLSRFEFAPVARDTENSERCGRLLPTLTQFEITMRAFGVMAVDRTMRASYSDYQRVSTTTH